MTLPSGGFFTLAAFLLLLNRFKEGSAKAHCTIEDAGQ